ncbi:ABC transporter ATP-binding protein [uncultured Clostridium sp.]|jgi:ABC-2 type transport system ATP-binding protein|uniref:ABC transporter ATP-binding protein n=1 Tax=Clostridium sp. TaxID=1506 RepID=UPI0025D4800E|nr:ABC transporter ATP-binding protein [uncultured Clostridium sp.]
MKYICIKNLTKSIKGNTILDNINYKFESGNIYGIYGHNGSGKTMLFRAISGLIRPTSGSINISGKELHKDIDFPESIGVVIENPEFWPNYTGWQVLKMLSNIKNIINDEDIEEALFRVGLDPNDKKTIKKYSLGMKQRLGIAQAIMEKADIIILDEPTNALDEDGIELIHKLILEEKKRGAIILIASHNKYDIDILSDIKLRMNGGKLIIE